MACRPEIGAAGHDWAESVDGLVYPTDEFPALGAIFVLARSVVGIVVAVKRNPDGHKCITLKKVDCKN